MAAIEERIGRGRGGQVPSTRPPSTATSASSSRASSRPQILTRRCPGTKGSRRAPPSSRRSACAYPHGRSSGPVVVAFGEVGEERDERFGACPAKRARTVRRRVAGIERAGMGSARRGARRSRAGGREQRLERAVSAVDEGARGGEVGAPRRERGRAACSASRAMSLGKGVAQAPHGPGNRRPRGARFDRGGPRSHVERSRPKLRQRMPRGAR